ncbi:MAG: hypothetical protein HKL83_09125 [Acidimicrobiaceae bacterium]|nr:hypothetical protein [Acidimicrobiaceae bacterium]
MQSVFDPNDIGACRWRAVDTAVSRSSALSSKEAGNLEFVQNTTRSASTTDTDLVNLWMLFLPVAGAPPIARGEPAFGGDSLGD